MKKRHRMWTVLTLVVAVLLVVPAAEAGKKKDKKKKKKDDAQTLVLAWPLTTKLEKSLLGYRTADARGQIDSAKGLSEAALELAWGLVLEQEKSYDEAVGRLEKAQKLAPTDPAPSIFLGETYLHAEKSGDASNAFKEAEKLARAALEAGPGDATAQGWLGVALQRQKRFDDALVALQKARDMDPGGRLHPYQLGATQAFMERWEDAVDSLTQALDMDSGVAYAYYYRGSFGRQDRSQRPHDQRSRSFPGPGARGAGSGNGGQVDSVGEPVGEIEN